MDDAYREAIRRSIPPQASDGGGVWLALATLTMWLSLAVTLLLLGGAAAEPCDDRGECFAAAIGIGWWTFFHMFAAIPMLLSIYVLVRRLMQGNPAALWGLAALGVNIVLAGVLLLVLRPYWWWT